MMIEKKKVAAAVVSIALMLLAIPAFAQLATGAESNTSRATFGNFGTDVDSFMSYFSFSGVEFNRYFSYAGYTDRFQLGYATRFDNGNYLGLLYSGRGVWQTDATKREVLSSNWNEGGELQNVISEVWYSGYDFHSENSVAALLGFGDNMGIKFGVYANTRTSNKNGNPGNPHYLSIEQNGDVTTYSGKIDSWKSANLNFTPFIGFGMNLDNGISPYINVKFGINPDESSMIIFNQYDESNGVYASRASGYVGGGVYSNLNLDVTAGAYIPLSDKWDLGIDYNINMGIWNNDYNIKGLKGNVKGVASWWDGSSSYGENYGPLFDEIDRTAGLTIEERKYFFHEVTPSLSTSSTINSLVEFAFACELPVSIEFNTTGNIGRTHTYNEAVYKNDLAQTRYTETINNYYNGENKVTTLDISPSLMLGAQVKAVPDRLNINAGIQINPVAYNRETTRITPNGYDTYSTVVKDGYGTVLQNSFTAASVNSMNDDELTTVTNWSGLSADYALGLTFYFTPNFSFDAVAAGAFGGQNFGSGINIANLRVLFSIKQ